MLLTRDVLERLCLARELLCQDAEPAASVLEVAKRVDISRFHFIRQFEAVFGETPHQLRIRTRIERAKKLLAMGELSVTEVCAPCGNMIQLYQPS